MDDDVVELGGPDERPGFPHNAVAHPLLCLPILWRLGELVHEATRPMVPTWRARWRDARAEYHRWMDTP
jgi:hypothetical protein